MVAQDQPQVIIYRKVSIHKWEQEYITDLKETVVLESIGLRIYMREIYEDVDFSPT